jgi:hypothetical protein
MIEGPRTCSIARELAQREYARPGRQLAKM